MKKLASILCVCFMSTVLVFSNLTTVVAATTTYTNPVGPEAADPFITYAGGNYYYVTSEIGDGKVQITTSPRLQDVGFATPTTVWTAPSGQAYSQEIWAPEIWYLDGHWYIYFCADDGSDANHRIFVLEGGTDSTNPLNGSYIYKGQVGTNEWSIDPSILTIGSTRYLMFAGHPNNSIKMVQLSNPYTTTGSSVVISSAQYAWEKVGASVNEAPEALYKNGKTMIVFSASHCSYQDYCLGLLTFNGGNVLSAGSWTKKSTSIFSKTSTVWGPGHNCFVKSPDGTEDWIYYHAKVNSNNGDGTRNLRMQKFTWNSDDTPKLGTPLSPSVAANEPSGTPTGSTWKTVDQLSATFSGTWESWTDTNCYGGGSKGSKTSGSYVNYTFSGTGVQWIGQKDSNFGQADVSIDGVFKTMVDCYNPTNQYQQVLYSITGLSNGSHTVQVWINGEHGNGSDNYIEVDAFKVIN